MRTTAEMLAAAEQKEREANAEVIRLRQQMEFEQSFGDHSIAYLVVRRCITTGRLESLIATFEDKREAHRFAGGLEGYGINQDIFIEDIPFYYMKGDK